MNLIEHRPGLCHAGRISPVNLDGVLVRCLLRLPPGSAGSPSARNGIQFFFKSSLSDEQWPSLYTRWQNIEPSWEGNCIELVARVERAGAAHVDPLFDPKAITLAGLKIGINSQSSATLRDEIYLYSYVLETNPPIAFEFDQVELEKDFGGIRDQSLGTMSVARIFIFCDGRAAPTFDAEGGVSGVDSAFYDDFDILAEAASRQGVQLIPVLLDYTWCSVPRRVSGVVLGGHSDVIRVADKRYAFLENALKPILQRYANHPAILAWEISNEIDWVLDENPDHFRDGFDLVRLGEMREFAAACAEYIHRFSPAHLVTVGSARRKWMTWFRDVGLDLYSFHWYPQYQPEEPFPWRPYEELGLDRPCFVGEVPTANTPYSPWRYIAAAAAGGYSGLLFWSCRAQDQFSNLGTVLNAVRTRGR